MKHFLVGILSSLLLLLGGSPQPEQNLGSTNYVQTQYFTLSGSGVSAGATSVGLKTFHNIDGTNLTMADFGTKGFGTLEPNNGTQEESITFTGVTQNANGTATLTGVSTCSNKTPYTETSGVAVTHPGGVKFVISNTACFYNTFANKGNNETVTGTWTFNTDPIASSTTHISGDPSSYATVYYVNQATTTGGINASVSIRGVSQEATDSMLQSSSSTGSTGARTFANGGSFAQTSTPNKVPVANGQGYIDPRYVPTTTLATLNSSSLVIQNPANATSTPTANSIPIADVNGKLDNWVSPNTTTIQLSPSTSVTSSYWSTIIPLIPMGITTFNDYTSFVGFNSVNQASAKVRNGDYVAGLMGGSNEAHATYLMGRSSTNTTFASSLETRIKFRAQIENIGDAAQHTRSFGLAATNTTFTQTIASTVAGVRFVDDTDNMYAVTANGTAVSSTLIAGIVPYNWNTYEIVFVSTSVNYYINNAFVASSPGSVAPSSTSNMVFGFGNQPNGRTINISDIQYSQKIAP